MANIIDELVSVMRYEIEGENEIKRFNRTVDKTEGELKRHARAMAGASKGADKAIKKHTKSGSNNLRGLNTDLDASTKKANMLAASIKGALAGVTIGAGINFSKDAFMDASRLERIMTRIGINANISREQTSIATDLIKNMSVDFGYSNFAPAIAALDVLIASSKEFEDAMNFMPSVLLTAQASGSETADIAKTAVKISTALKIPAEQMTEAFGIMIASGNSGMFELKDMAQHLPSLANNFARLGYEGTDGLIKLTALMQALTEKSSDAGTVTTQLDNIFIKMKSPETVNKFKKLGVNLKDELAQAKKEGKDLIKFYAELSSKAIGGKMDDLGDLFTDKELLVGMSNLITNFDRLKFFESEALKNENIGLKQFNRVMEDSIANVDKLSSNWAILKTNLGAKVALGINPILEATNAGFAKKRNKEALIEEQRVIDKNNGYKAGFLEKYDDTAIQKRIAERVLKNQGFEKFNELPIDDSAKFAFLRDKGISTGEQASIYRSGDLSKLKGRLSDLENMGAKGIVTDASVTNNDNSVTHGDTHNNINIEQNVSKATDAPGKAAQATAREIKRTIPKRAQLETEPVAP